jgi:transposase
MNFVGVDLHKHSISVCVMIQHSSGRRVADRKRFACRDEDQISAYLSSLRPFRLVVEATAAYEWFARLVEPLADRFVLAHPKKLRIIAESAKKTDKLDAQTLAEFLALDMIPESWRPTPRVREHRVLVRTRCRVQRRMTALKNAVRHHLAGDNADIPHLFTPLGRAYLAQLTLAEADRFCVDLLMEELDQQGQRLKRLDRKLAAFALDAPVAEREARAVLATMPGVGRVTIDVVLSELGDARRFRSQRKAAAFAGLAPGLRQSAGRTRQLGITKEGSRLVRWALVQAAWRAVRLTARWRTQFDQLKRRAGAKKAIVAIARRLWCVMIAMLKSGQAYRLTAPH